MDQELEQVARAICQACEENPDHQGDARGNACRWQDYIPMAKAAMKAVAAAAELAQLRAIADELIAFQAEYAEKAFEPGGMPGNEYYRPKLVNIVDMARAARGQ